MSEFQYIAFRAIDGPVSKKNLAYMHAQSSRAEITPWSFDNEYHFGDFRGNALEMLRRGYDLHFHYANFGVRHLIIRTPHGLPDASGTQAYFAGDSLRYHKDKKGAGGALAIRPYHESGELDELWDIGEIVDRLVPLRAEILGGDLRPLYLAHLAIAVDDEHDPEETVEGPVPAGLDKISDAQRALAEVYGLSAALISAAARESPPLVTPKEPSNPFLQWLREQPEATKDAWLAGWMSESQATVKAEIQARFQKSRSTPSWPTAAPARTLAELQAIAVEIESEGNRKSAQKVARRRQG